MTEQQESFLQEESFLQVCDINNNFLGIECNVYNSLVVVLNIPKLTVQIGLLQPNGNVVLGQIFVIEDKEVQRTCCSLRVSFCEITNCLAVVSFIGIVQIIRVSDDNLSGEVICSVDVQRLNDAFTIIDYIDLSMSILTIVVMNKITNIDLEKGNVLCLDKMSIFTNSTIEFGRIESDIMVGSTRKMVVLGGQKIEIEDRSDKFSINSVFYVDRDPNTRISAVYSNCGKIFLLKSAEDMLSGECLCTINLNSDEKKSDEPIFPMIQQRKTRFGGMSYLSGNIAWKPKRLFRLETYLLDVDDDGSAVWFASNTEICFVEFRLDSTKSKVVCLNRMNDDKSSLGAYRILSITRYENLIVFTTGTHRYQIYDRRTKEKICELW
jgi:hypothetical protein